MTTEEAITNYIVPAIKRTWNDKKCKEILEVLEQESKWIPVSERLPEEDGLYLVYTEEQPFVCRFEDNGFFIDDVLAWVPLPKAYEPHESEG